MPQRNTKGGSWFQDDQHSNQIQLHEPTAPENKKKRLWRKPFTTSLLCGGETLWNIWKQYMTYVLLKTLHVSTITEEMWLVSAPLCEEKNWSTRVDITNNQKKTNAGKGLCLCPDPMTVPQKEQQPSEFLPQLGPLLLSWLRSEGPACCLQYLGKVWSQIGAKLATDSSTKEDSSV